MNKILVLSAITVFTITLSLSYFVPDVMADSNSGKQQHNHKKILEFNSGTIMSTSSTTIICHVPPGNPDNSHEIVVSTSSLTAHLKHGDNKSNCSN